MVKNLMDHPLYDLITAKILAAEAEGAFDNLPGAGKPLPRVEDPENELINRLMRENGAVPEFVSLGTVNLRGSFYVSIIVLK